jgi:hypothetical protein
LLLAAILILIWPQPKKGNEYFTLEPETWIEEDKNTIETEDYEINMFKATRRQGNFDVSQLDLFTENELYSFFYHGFYNGSGFQTLALRPEFYNLTKEQKEQKTDEYSLMRITKNIKPQDNIPDAFLLFKFENKLPVIYIFLDEDWKIKYPNTNIIWGSEFKNMQTLNQKEFIFINSTYNIYINKIDKNLNFYDDPIQKGGIAVGPITSDKISRFFNEEDLNLTFIYMR